MEESHEEGGPTEVSIQLQVSSIPGLSKMEIRAELMQALTGVGRQSIGTVELELERSLRRHIELLAVRMFCDWMGYNVDTWASP
jgi:hypothetical protein